MTEGKEAVKEVKEFLAKSKPALIVNRVPQKTLDFFYLLAKEDCSDDYGMALKHLCDFYKGAVGFGFERTEMKVDLLSEQVAELQSESQVQPQEKQNVIRTVDGKEKVIKDE